MTGAPKFGITTVREAAQKQVDQTSLRAVAEEVGMSFSGLRSFLDGGMPQLSTGEKLVRWYARRQENDSGTPSRQDVEAALTLLSEFVAAAPTEERRKERVRDVTKRLTAATPTGRK